MDKKKKYTGKRKRKKDNLSELFYGKLPPQAIDLEEAVLGALMLDKDAIALIIDILRPSSFYKDAHKEIYQAICNLFEKSNPIDLLTVTEELKQIGSLEQVGGPYQLVSLTNRVASSANIEYHARIISQKFIQRELIRTSTETIREAYEDTTDVLELLDKAEQNLFEITQQNLSRGSLGMNTLVNMAVKQLEELAGKEEGLTGVPTGFTSLDRLTSGWQPSDLIIVAARPGMGKCLAKGTQVVMYDGSLRKVEEVEAGEQLMGDDSTPRKVLSIAQGQEQMYWIRQQHGISYRVNASHILSLQSQVDGSICNISVKEWLQKTADFKANHWGYKKAVDFVDKPTDVAPYWVGLTYMHQQTIPTKENTAALTTATKEILALANHQNTAIAEKVFHTPALQAILQQNSALPTTYIVNSRTKRLALLAGCLDACGSYFEATNSYKLTIRKKALAQQMKFLCDSLGFRTNLATSSNYCLQIEGNIDEIPVRLLQKAETPQMPWQATPISVEKDVVDNYYGFTLDGNNLFLLQDMTVTHNTSFTMAVARNAAIDFNKGVAFFSLEMSSLQLVNRLISMETEIASEKLRKGQLEDYEWQQLHSVVEKLSDVPIFIDDTPGISIFELRAKCRRLKMQHDIQLVVIDYLQLMTGGGDKKHGNREQEISMISRGLKGLAKELNVPVIALSQLSRAVETRGGSKRPQLSDLRESGAIEQDADIVSFIYRPEYYEILEDEEGNSLRGIGEIIVAKHRNGALETIRLKWDGQYAKFTNLDDEAFMGLDDTSFFDQANDQIGGQTFSSKINKDDNGGNGGGIDDVPF